MCSSPEIGCLDPATLGVARVIADYRVRAEGPGGKGPWCEPLRVDLRVPVDDDDDDDYNNGDTGYFFGPPTAAAGAAAAGELASGGGGSRHISVSGDISTITCTAATARGEKENKGCGGSGGGGPPSSSRPQQQPMGFLRPGTRVRDSLTGEARRLWTKQRPLRVSPPPATVAALVRPGAVVTARTLVLSGEQHRPKRVETGHQLFWGE